VKFEGAAPKTATIQMGADPYSSRSTRSRLQDEDGSSVRPVSLANVFVYIKNPPAGTTRRRGPHMLDQQGCKYSPHVSGIRFGQKLDIRTTTTP